MKRFILPFFVVALTLIPSCNKQEEMVVEKLSPRFHGGMEPVLVDSETRAYVDENYKVYWNAGDHVTIFYEKTYNREYEFVGRTGTTGGEFERFGSDPAHFTEVVIESGFEYAILPYQRFNGCDYDGTLTVPFPANRTYEENARGIGIYPYMVARDKDGDFMFMHIAGYLGLKLYGEGAIKSISLKSTNNEPISGYPVVVFTDDTDEAEPVLTFVNDPDDSPRSTVTYPDPIALPATAAEAKTFWLSLPPTVMTKGFTLTFTGANGEVVTKSRSSSFVVERKKIKTLGPLEIVMDSSPVTVTGVELNKSEIELAVNETEALTATVLPENATDKTVSWSSSNTNVATVSSNGVVTAVSAGTAVITVTTNTGGKTATCVVTVKEDAPVITYSLAIDPQSAEIKFGETKAFTLTLTTTTNGVAATETVTGATWTTSDANVATVANGTATGTGAGTATITAKYTPAGSEEELSASASLTVTNVVSYSLAIDPESAEIKSGETQAFTLTLTTTTNGVAATETVTGATWASSDATVATVANGTATGIGAGTATITAKFTPEGSEEELSASASLKVTVDVITYSLAIDPESAEILVGGTKAFTLTLTTTTNGEAATQTVTGATWTSSDANVATVANGTATGVAEGTVTITAKYTPEGSAEELTVTAQLTVNKEPNHAGDPVEIEEGGNL